MSEILEKAEVFATQIANQSFSERLVYHDINTIYDTVSAVEEIAIAEKLSEDETEIVLLAGWLSNLGLSNLDSFGEITGVSDFYEKCLSSTNLVVKDFLKKHNYPAGKTNILLETIAAGFPQQTYDTKLKKIFADANTANYAKPGGKTKLKNLYDEYTLIGALDTNKVEWYNKVIAYLKGHQYLTDYGKNTLAKGKLKLIDKVVKEQKSIVKTQDQIISKDLNISDAELKKLKKKLVSVKGRDERGIQTMLRTVSRNHYTLNQMIDRKANIMISINAILMSLILGRLLSMDERFCIHNAPMLIFLLTSLISIMLAVFAIRPAKTHGTFTENDIRNKEGNLLYFGNYHSMTFRDYRWGMLQMMNDGDNLYTSMIRDLYYLGKMLNAKSKLIRKSLNIFVLGFILSVLAFVILTPLVGSHF